MPTAGQLCVAVALICTASILSVCSSSEEACAGSLFFTTIVGRDFSDKLGSKEEDADIAVLQTGGRPLSPWLNLERGGNGPSTTIVLYGTPDSADIGTLSLEVWSILNGSSRILLKTLQIMVTQPPDRVYTAVKFPVIGATAYGLFQSGKIFAFERLSKSLFKTKGVLVRVAPLEGTSGIDVTISPGYGFLSLPGTAQEKVDELISCCQRQGKSPRFKTGELLTAAGLDIDWCNIQQLVERQGPLHSLRRRSTLGLQTMAAASNDSFILPPSYEGSNTPLVVIAIIAATVTVLATTALAWVFFGGRRKGFYISHKRTIEQRILRDKEKQIISKVAKAQKVLMDLSLPGQPLPSHPVAAQPTVDEIAEDHVSIPSLLAEPLPPYVYPRSLLQYPSTVTSV